jgi:Ser/Thr protein kinase RdoA (MazF antagonist)
MRLRANDAEIAEALSRLGADARHSEDMAEGQGNRLCRFLGPEGELRVLRIRTRWVTEKRIGFEHAFAAHLSADGLPAVLPLPVDGRRTWLKVGDFLCEVLPFIQGCRPALTPAHARLAGALLADFHRSGSAFNMGKYEPPAEVIQLEPHQLEPLLQPLRQLARGGMAEGMPAPARRELFRALEQRWEKLRRRYPQGAEDLPKTMRHGDFHPWNLLYSDAGSLRIVALLDLDMLEVGTRIYDVSYAVYTLLWGLLMQDGGAPGDFAAHRPVYEAFVSAYLAATDTPVTAEEVGLMPMQIECVALRFVLWYLPGAKNAAAMEKMIHEHYLRVAQRLDHHRAELLRAFENSGG